MIITNTIIKVKQEFKNKNEIKQYLYSFIENHPFRKYNQQIADEYGEDLFSMTFVPKDTVVLTQRYPTKKLYIESIHLRLDVIDWLRDVVEYYKTSDPFEINYDRMYRL